MVIISPLSQIKNTKNINSIAFQGHKLQQDNNGNKIYRFYLPNFEHAKDSNPQIILKVLEKDNKGNIDIDSSKENPEEIYEMTDNKFEISAKELDLDDNQVLAYRFLVNDKKYTDKHNSIIIDNTEYNLADRVSSEILSYPGTMYHLVPKIFNIKPENATEKTNVLGEKIIVNNTEARMTHVGQQKTSLKDIKSKIEYMKQMGIRRILSTPVFGQDNLSLHGYWTTNPFQINSSLGNMKDFADLQTELFKNSMSFVADGALVNEGLQGIHLRDIIKYGVKSPFVNWFETHNLSQNGLKLGILPDSEKGKENYDVRVVNSPVIWTVNSEGLPTGNFGEINKSYKPHKPTYIQFYDKRLTTPDDISNDKLMTSYSIFNTKNKNEISDWMDTVQLYSFPVPAAEVIKKALTAASDKTQCAKNTLLNWENFAVTTAKNSGGITLWNGNKDIAKLRFAIIGGQKEYGDLSAENEKLNNSAKQVQDYILNVGKFWTNKTSKILRSYVLKAIKDVNIPSKDNFSDEEINEIYNKITSKINSKSSENNFYLPENLKTLNKEQVESALVGKYIPNKKLPTISTFSDLFKEYPFEALETNDNVTTIFSYPDFKDKVNERLFRGIMKQHTQDILKYIDEQKVTDVNLLNEDKTLNQTATRITQLITDDIVRFLLIKSLSPDATIQNITDYNNSLDILKNISTEKLGINPKSPEEATELLLNIMDKNLRKLTSGELNEFSKVLAKNLDGVTTKKIELANLILDKTEAGLNWRIDASKEVADIDNYIENTTTSQENWDVIMDFWNKFNTNVNKYNPHAYKIAEITDIADIARGKNIKDYDFKELESRMIDREKFTTETNYNYLYSTLIRLFAHMPENNDNDHFQIMGTKGGEKVPAILQTFIDGFDCMKGYLKMGSKNAITHSHTTVANQDKPRISHTFCIDSRMAYAYNKKNDAMKEALSDCFTKAVNSLKNKENKENKEENQEENEIKSTLITKFNSGLNNVVNDEQSNKTFFYRTFEDNFNEIWKRSEMSEYEQLKDTLKSKTHYYFTEPARKKGLALTQIMVGLPGNPTIYAGDELLETGSEEKAKNVYLQNRNRLQWERLTDTNYQHVKNYQKEIAEVLKMRSDENLSPLVDGDTIPLDADNPNILSLYRYNDKDELIVILNSSGFNATREDIPQTEEKSDKSINKVTIDGIKPWGFANGTNNYGLPEGINLDKDTKFVNYYNTEEKYKICDDCQIRREDGSKFTINSPITILKRVK